MPLTDDELRDLLHTARAAMREVGLGGVDERIALRTRGAETPHDDLAQYLTHLIEDVSLGADESVRLVLSRLRNVVETESGELVSGIRVDLSEEEARRYDRPFFDLGQSRAPQGANLEQAALSDLRLLLAELRMDRESQRRG